MTRWKGAAMKIMNQKHGNLTEAQLDELAALLYKAGYAVRKTKERLGNKETGRRIVVIEVIEEAKNE